MKRMKKRDEEGWSQEWSGEDDEDACAGYQPDLGRHVSFGTLMLHREMQKMGHKNGLEKMMRMLGQVTSQVSGRHVTLGTLTLRRDMQKIGYKIGLEKMMRILAQATSQTFGRHGSFGTPVLHREMKKIGH